MAVGIRCADHVTPLCPQKLALTSPTGGGRSVAIVRSRTKDTEFSFSVVFPVCVFVCTSCTPDEEQSRILYFVSFRVPACCLQALKISNEIIHISSLRA
jgi:hypothetical protein